MILFLYLVNNGENGDNGENCTSKERKRECEREGMSNSLHIFSLDTLIFDAHKEII